MLCSTRQIGALVLAGRRYWAQPVAPHRASLVLSPIAKTPARHDHDCAQVSGGSCWTEEGGGKRRRFIQLLVLYEPHSASRPKITRQILAINWCGCCSRDTLMSIGFGYAAAKKNIAAATNGISCLKFTPAIIAPAGPPGGKRPAVFWLPGPDSNQRPTG